MSIFQRLHEYSGPTGDTISVRPLYCAPFEVLPTYKVMMHTNHLPQIQGQDYAIWRRLHTIPFTVTIQGKDQDKTLGDKLKEESAGILNWAIEGCIEWQHVGLSPPSAVLIATEQYRADMDIIGDWIQQCCVLDSTMKSKFADLYRSYIDWAERNNQAIDSKSSFGRRLKDHGLHQVKKSGVRYYTGLAINGLPIVQDD